MANRKNKKRKAPAQRFNALVTKQTGPDACWLFSNANSNGYGTFQLTDKSNIVSSHRFAWQQANGPIPEGMCVLHRCDNRRCVRPSHLFLGTKADNSADMKAKGRQSKFADRKPVVRLTPAQREDIIAKVNAGATIYSLTKATGRRYRHLYDLVTSARTKPMRTMTRALQPQIDRILSNNPNLIHFPARKPKPVHNRFDTFIPCAEEWNDFTLLINEVA